VDCIQFFFGGNGDGGLRINSISAVYEYGYAPRKAYPVIAAFCHIVPPEAKIEKTQHLIPYTLYAYVFSRKNDAVAVVWSPEKDYTVDKEALRGVEVLDIFGEPIEGDTVSINESAIYLVGDSVEAVSAAATALKEGANLDR